MSVLPKISVVTPSFNSARTIRETLQSVQNQRYPNCEHLVIDGGSTDGTLGIVKEFPGAKWISEKDSGIYDAMNKGVGRANGEIIGILNSDDRYRPGALTTVAETFTAHPDWDALFGDIINIDERGGEIYRRREVKYDYAILLLGRICYIIHPTLFVRKRVYETLGVYNQDYPRSADYDFILRLGKSGCTVGHVRQFLAEFRYHRGGQTSDFRVLAAMEKELQRLWAEYSVPTGKYGQLICVLMRLKRQAQKLLYRGTVDLRRGDTLLRRYRYKSGTFSTNIPMETLKS